MCSCIRTNEGISSHFPEIPSEPLGRVPLHPSSDIYPSLQGGINLQNPRLPPRFEWFGHNAYFLGPQNFCPQQQNKKKLRPFFKLPKGSPFFKNGPCIWLLPVWGGEYKRSPEYMSNFLVVRFWGVGEGSERFPGCFVVWCTPFVLISFVMASIRNRVWKGRGAQKLFWQCPCIRGASLGITYLYVNIIVI